MINNPISQEARLAVPDETHSHKNHLLHCPDEEIIPLKDFNSGYVYGKLILTRLSQNAVTFSILATLEDYQK